MSRRERKEQTRQALLDAAEREFAEKGIAGASLDSVAAAAGMTKGAVYSNFAGKDELIVALLGRHRQRVETPPAIHSLAGEPGDDLFGALGEWYAGLAERPEMQRWTRLVVELLAHALHEPRSRALLADAYRQSRAEMADELRDLVPHPATAAALIAAVDLGIAVQHVLDPEAVPAALYGEALRRLLTAPADDPLTTAPEPPAPAGSPDRPAT